MSTTLTQSILEDLVKLQTSEARKWMFELKQKAEQTNSPEMFELYFRTAQVYTSLIKSIQELAKQYTKQATEAATFDLNMWVKYQRLLKYCAHLQKELETEQKDLINFVTMTVSFNSQKH